MVLASLSASQTCRLISYFKNCLSLIDLRFSFKQLPFAQGLFKVTKIIFPYVTKCYCWHMLLFAWRHGDILKLTYLNTVYRTTRQFSPESPTVGTSIFFSKSTASTVAPSFSKNILRHPLIHRVFRVQSLSNLYILPHWGNFHIYVYINGKCICESDNGI